MIHRWLMQDLQDVFTRNPHARVLLWFDKENEFSRLLDAGAVQGAPFRLLRYEVDRGRGVFHGAFWVKTQIEWETRDLPAEQRESLRFVVHIPMRREALDEPRDAEELSLECLLEYKHSGKVWLLDGYAPTLFCPGCGWVAPCPRCDARLTVHQRERSLDCHHCGTHRPIPGICSWRKRSPAVSRSGNSPRRQ